MMRTPSKKQSTEPATWPNRAARDTDRTVAETLTDRESHSAKADGRSDRIERHPLHLPAVTQ